MQPSTWRTCCVRPMRPGPCPTAAGWWAWCVNVQEENRSGWFWYWMSDGARGRGWMRRAAATVADWALTRRGLQRLELGHRVNNPASGAVAGAAGFVREGTEREKFLIAGDRIDVATYGRLLSDPWPQFEPLAMIED